MSYIDFIGFVAGALTTLALLPQVLKSWRTKSTSDVSRRWILMLVTGAFLWIIYGFFISSVPVIVANIATLSLASMVLALKLKFG